MILHVICLQTFSKKMPEPWGSVPAQDRHSDTQPQPYLAGAGQCKKTLALGALSADEAKTQLKRWILEGPGQTLQNEPSRGTITDKLMLERCQA